MDAALHRHDISDRGWDVIAPHLPGKKGDWGGVAKDNRQFINAVVWILRTGAPWRDLPPEFGDWKTRIVDFAAGATREFGSVCSLL